MSFCAGDVCTLYIHKYNVGKVKNTKSNDIQPMVCCEVNTRKCNTQRSKSRANVCLSVCPCIGEAKCSIDRRPSQAKHNRGNIMISCTYCGPSISSVVRFFVTHYFLYHINMISHTIRHSDKSLCEKISCSAGRAGLFSFVSVLFFEILLLSFCNFNFLCVVFVLRFSRFVLLLFFFFSFIYVLFSRQ